MKSIILADPTDVASVVAALQEAVDEVLNASSLQEAAGNGPSSYASQYIHPVNSSAVACATLQVGGFGELQDMTRLSVEIKLPTGPYNTGSAALYVPRTIISRLRVQLDNPYHRRRKFVDEPENHRMVVHLDLPTRTFQRYPKAVIEVV